MSKAAASSVSLNPHQHPGLRALQAVTGRLVGFAHDRPRYTVPVVQHLQRGRAFLRRFLPKPSPRRYWEERARRYGARSVVHIGHGDDAELARTALCARIP